MRSKTHRVIIAYTLFIYVFCLPALSKAASCEIDGLAGTWVEITQYVPMGDCLGVTYDQFINSTLDYAFGETDKYRVYIPAVRGYPCVSPNYLCDCVDYESDIIANDGQPDCLGMSPRCLGTHCQGGDCNDCWSLSCIQMVADDGSHRRMIYECVSNDCLTEYNTKQQECGNARILNWDNVTCTGVCDSCTIDQYNAMIDECGGIEKIAEIFPDCTALCVGGKNLGPQDTCEDRQ